MPMLVFSPTGSNLDNLIFGDNTKNGVKAIQNLN
jgi:hypothetical protein